MKLSEEHFRRRKRTFWKKMMVAGVAIATIGATTLTLVFWVKAVVVEIRPEAAALKAQRTLQGSGWIQQDKVYLLASRAVLQITAPGFIGDNITLQRGMPERHITITLKEAPAMIRATVKPADERIKWHINGELTDTGPQLQTTVEPGAYRLEVSHPYYQPQQSLVDVERGTEKVLSFELSPVQGQLNLHSSPQGASVLLDGNVIGQTPVTMMQQGGRHNLRVELPDFEPINDVVEITHGQPTINRSYRLNPRQASLDFTLIPPDGQLSINGKIQPITDMPIKLESGRELRISYSKAGYLTKTIKRTLKPARKENIHLQLEPEYGKVIIETTPPSDIKINNETKGRTPQTMTLQAIPHNIHLSRPGYRPIQKTIHPGSQRVIHIDETLLTNEQAQLAESPAVARNSIGLELVLFKPDKTASFQIGAHRSETGQRANEILRTIKLDKAFYISRTEITARHYSEFAPGTPASGLAVSNITWNEAALFCNWLSEKENLPHFYLTNGNNITGYNPQSTGYRLPSEAEWEWLARHANRRTPSRFIWGNKATVPAGVGNLADESAKANVATYIPGYNDGHPKVAPPGSFKRDRAGLYDLLGNVSEWVHDAYAVDAKIMGGPLGPSNNTGRSGHVVKGSSWRSGRLTELRSAYRQRAVGPADDRGFRVARYIY